MADNLMGDVPLDFQPQMQNISQQQKLSQMLLQQGMQQPQGQMVSGHYVAPALTQYLAPLFGAYAGSKGMETAEQKQLDLAKAIRSQGDIAAKDVMETYKQDPQAALTKALQYQQFPQVKAVLPQLSKVGINEAPLSKQEFDIAKAAGFPGNYNQFLEWSANLKTPKTSIYNTMPPAESEYAKTVGAGVGKQDLALKDIADSAQGVLDNVTRQKQILKSEKVITGFGAEPRLALAQFGQAIGAGGKNADELVANTQSLLAGRAGATLDAIKTSNLGSAQGFSNTDRDFLEKAKLGGIKYTAESLNRQLDIEAKIARMGVDKYNKRLQEMPKSASSPINMNPIKLSNDDPLGIR
jgi:hypothetical protein